MSPALEVVDSSSGAIGTAVNHAIEELVAIIAKAPAAAKTREPEVWQAAEAGIACRSAAPRDRSGEELALFRRVGDPALRVDRRLAFEEWFR